MSLLQKHPGSKKASYTASRKGYHLIVDDVPAWVCEQCGEPLFDEETVDVIQDMLRQVDMRMEKLAVPVAAM
ncbi:MAG: YgiT-type zinc finger protein [Anaerolineae bacterium]|nr:YgiT-type zinc finger protein [Anaerolineae bacterium]